MGCYYCCIISILVISPAVVGYDFAYCSTSLFKVATTSLVVLYGYYVFVSVFIISFVIVVTCFVSLSIILCNVATTSYVVLYGYAFRSLCIILTHS
jgi:hypothetical protein